MGFPGLLFVTASETALSLITVLASLKCPAPRPGISHQLTSLRVSMRCNSIESSKLPTRVALKIHNISSGGQRLISRPLVRKA